MRRIFPLLGLALVTLFGCGGSGSSGGGNGVTPILISDDLSTTIDHVWVTIEGVSVVRKDGSVMAADLGDGKTVDLAVLHDGATPIFSLLSSLPVRPEVGDRIHVELGETASVHPVGTGVNVVATFAGAVGGRKSFDAYQTLATDSSRGLRIDFDLAGWTLTGTSIDAPDGTVKQSPVKAESVGHARDLCSGVASGRRSISGGAFTFSVGGVAVVAGPHTAVNNEDGTESPHVQDGDRLHVQGTYSADSHALVADTISVSHGEPTLFCEATVSASDAASFPVFPINARTCSFRPVTTQIVVAPSSTATFVDDSVPTDWEVFRTRLLAGDTVEMSGSYNSGTNVFTATYIRKVSATPTVLMGFLYKTKSNIKNDFVINPNHWLGFDHEAGTTVRIAGGSSASYLFGDTEVSQQAFIDLLADGDQVVLKCGSKGPGYDLKSATKV